MRIATRDERRLLAREWQHDSYDPGLHHFCLRIDSVEEVAKLLKKSEIKVSEPKLYSEYTPDYVAVFLSDPDGIRTEITNCRKERRQRYESWPKIAF